MALKSVDSKAVAGELKAVPNLPIITVAEDTKTLNVVARSAAAQEPKIMLAKEELVTLERLRHRPFLTGRFEGRRGCVSESRGRRSAKTLMAG